MSSTKLRKAVRKDQKEFEELVDLKIEAYSDLPLWDYWYPDRAQNMSALREYVRGQFAGDFEDCANGTSEMIVVEENDKIIAFSVWQMVVTKPEEPKGKPEASPTGPSPTFIDSNTNKTRISETIKKSQSALRDVFWKRYDKRQCRLIEMGTHPKHRRKGAARMMLEAALQRAAKDEIAVTMFASPMGREVYKRAGFIDLKKVTVQIEGEKEYLDMFCMAQDCKLPK